MMYNRSIVIDIYVFFFKQKTAYEMRICDWISDVCSSDLVALPLRRGEFARFRHIAAETGRIVAGGAIGAEAHEAAHDRPPHRLDVILRRLIGQLEFGARKGRALEKPNQLFRLLWILDDAEELDHGLVEVVVELRFRRRLLQHHRGAAAERPDIGHLPVAEGETG